MADVYRVNTGDGYRKIPESFCGLIRFIEKAGQVCLKRVALSLAMLNPAHFELL
jgi:hypothetical protein